MDNPIPKEIKKSSPWRRLNPIRSSGSSI